MSSSSYGGVASARGSASSRHRHLRALEIIGSAHSGSTMTISSGMMHHSPNHSNSGSFATSPVTGVNANGYSSAFSQMTIGQAATAAINGRRGSVSSGGSGAVVPASSIPPAYPTTKSLYSASQSETASLHGHSRPGSSPFMLPKATASPEFDRRAQAARMSTPSAMVSQSLGQAMASSASTSGSTYYAATQTFRGEDVHHQSNQSFNSQLQKIKERLREQRRNASSGATQQQTSNGIAAALINTYGATREDLIDYTPVASARSRSSTPVQPQQSMQTQSILPSSFVTNGTFNAFSSSSYERARIGSRQSSSTASSASLRPTASHPYSVPVSHHAPSQPIQRQASGYGSQASAGGAHAHARRRRSSDSSASSDSEENKESEGGTTDESVVSSAHSSYAKPSMVPSGLTAGVPHRVSSVSASQHLPQPSSSLASRTRATFDGISSPPLGSFPPPLPVSSPSPSMSPAPSPLSSQSGTPALHHQQILPVRATGDLLREKQRVAAAAAATERERKEEQERAEMEERKPQSNDFVDLLHAPVRYSLPSEPLRARAPPLRAVLPRALLHVSALRRRLVGLPGSGRPDEAPTSGGGSEAAATAAVRVSSRLRFDRSQPGSRQPSQPLSECARGVATGAGLLAVLLPSCLRGRHHSRVRVSLRVGQPPTSDPGGSVGVRPARAARPQHEQLLAVLLLRGEEHQAGDTNATHQWSDQHEFQQYCRRIFIILQLQHHHVSFQPGELAEVRFALQCRAAAALLQHKEDPSFDRAGSAYSLPSPSSLRQLLQSLHLRLVRLPLLRRRRRRQRRGALLAADHHGGRDRVAPGGFDIAYYRSHTGPSGEKSKSKNYTLSFSVEFEYDFDTVFIAMAYPYTVTTLYRTLSSYAADPARRSIFRQRVLCQTLGGNDCPLVTITDYSASPAEIARRPAVVVSARVHSGETNASWIMQGVMDFLLTVQGGHNRSSINSSGTDLSPHASTAALLRSRYVFYLIPMLNVDGVYNGSYRCSLAGVDLNRQWLHPDPIVHPTIYKTKELIANLTGKELAPHQQRCATGEQSG